MIVSFDKFTGGFMPILKFLPVTLEYTFLIFFFSIIMGIILALLSLVKNKGVQFLLGVWISFFRGIPILVLLFFFLYGLFPVIHMDRVIPLGAQFVIAMVLAFSSYMSETIRGSILSIDKGQMEGCLSIGMTTFQAMRRVILPQAIKVAVPPLSNSFLDILKGTSFGATVGVIEMFLRAQMMAAMDYHFLEYYLDILVIYWVLNIIFTRIQKMIEAKFAENS